MIYSIFAVDQNFGIGKNGDIPWHSADDFSHFKNTTSGASILMGRKTWESLKVKPLPNRNNFVVSSTLIDDRANVIHPAMLSYFMNDYVNNKIDLYVIGGKQLLEQCINYYGEQIVTKINGVYDCDVVIDRNILNGFVLYKTSILNDGSTVEYYRK